MFNKVIGLIRLFRGELPIAAGICVLLGEIVALAHLPTIREAALGFICGFFLSATALILNDYFDLEVDRVNAPKRPLPSGLVSKTDVIALSVVTTLIGLGAALWIGLPAFLISILFWFIGFLYNWKFKQTGLLGNLMVSASTAVTFVLGGMIVGDTWNRIVWTLAFIGFFVDLGEEIGCDAMDMEGDKKRGSRSVAILKGRPFAIRIAASLFFLVVLISFIPVVFGWLDMIYVVVISVTSLFTIYFAVQLIRSKTLEQGRFSLRGIYLVPVVGMSVFIIGKVLTGVFNP
jgi:geranylgeranylglycerol-phosphate geranylgeranyltransferase